MKAKHLIREYIGAHFYFLLEYLNGGYAGYVRSNLAKITRKRAFGREIVRAEYREIKSPSLLIERVLNDCADTLEYIKQNTK